MSGHTPGPWRLGALPPTEWGYIIAPDGSEIAAVAEWDVDGAIRILFQGDAAHANARLIAAAPQMLEALKAYAITENIPHAEPHAIAMANAHALRRAALAAAEGAE